MVLYHFFFHHTKTYNSLEVDHRGIAAFFINSKSMINRRVRKTYHVRILLKKLNQYGFQSICNVCETRRLLFGASNILYNKLKRFDEDNVRRLDPDGFTLETGLKLYTFVVSKNRDFSNPENFPVDHD